jgi:poly(3-hydroxybutyrate) depolymerase
VAVLVVITAGAVWVANLRKGASAQDLSTTAATSGCGNATLASGTHTIQSGGRDREFILSLPDGYVDNQPYRLVFVFHPRGGTATGIESGGDSGLVGSHHGLRAAWANSTIFVAPQGLDNGWANDNGRDVTFVDGILEYVEAGLCVDTDRRFSVGFSFGGAMSYALACARPTVFRAVVVYGAGEVSGCSGGTDAVAYLGIHGITDNILTVSQGRELRDTFVRNNGCVPQDAPEPAEGSLTHIVTDYEGCQDGFPVVWAAFDGGHTPSPVDGSGSLFEPIEDSWTGPLVLAFLTQFDFTAAPRRPDRTGLTGGG